MGVAERLVPFEATPVERPDEVSVPLVDEVPVIGAVPLDEEVVSTVPFPEKVGVPLLVGGSVTTSVDIVTPDEVNAVVAFPVETMMDPLTADPEVAKLEVGTSVRLANTLDSREDADVVPSEVLAEIVALVFAVAEGAPVEVSTEMMDNVSETMFGIVEKTVDTAVVPFSTEIVPAVPITDDRDDKEDNDETDARLRDSVSMIAVVTVNVENTEFMAVVENGLSDGPDVADTSLAAEDTEAEASPPAEDAVAEV